MTTQSAGSTPSAPAAATINPGAGFRHRHPSHGPCGQTIQGPSGPSSSSTRRLTASTCSTRTYPRATPLWLLTTAVGTPAARSRPSASRAPGITTTRSGSPL
jgi:hypothetical protein